MTIGQDHRRHGSVDPVDLARFERLGAEWWDPEGPMGKLHEINAVRMGYLRDILTRTLGPVPTSKDHIGLPWQGLTMLDIGCGGGVLSEPLARLGAIVTGIDPGAENIAVARRHADESGLTIDYRCTTAEILTGEPARFDVVLAMEVVEHVIDPDGFIETACSLVRPGGMLIASTLNRTAKSFLLAIVGAEYVLRWLPRGTHRWQQFMTTEELAEPVKRAGLDIVDLTGMVFDPLRGDWRLSRDMDVNYLVAARKPAG